MPPSSVPLSGGWDCLQAGAETGFGEVCSMPGWEVPPRPARGTSAPPKFIGAFSSEGLV